MVGERGSGSCLSALIEIRARSMRAGVALTHTAPMAIAGLTDSYCKALQCRSAGRRKPSQCEGARVGHLRETRLTDLIHSLENMRNA